MANSLKVSELERWTDSNKINGNELLLISKDPSNAGLLSSYGISYGLLSAKIYDSVLQAAMDEIKAVSAALSAAVVEAFDNYGYPYLNDISCNKDNIVTTKPKKTVGISAIYDICAELSTLRNQSIPPRWQ